MAQFFFDYSTHLIVSPPFGATVTAIVPGQCVSVIESAIVLANSIAYINDWNIILKKR